jgi:hypothetical protein
MSNWSYDLKTTEIREVLVESEGNIPQITGGRRCHPETS